MKIIKPRALTTSDVTSSVTITESIWSAGTYNKGVQKYKGTTLYEVIADPSTSDDPTVGVLAVPPTWKDIGAINQWKMFDGKYSSQTVDDEEVSVTINIPSITNSIAALNIDGETLAVKMTDSIDGVVYETEIDLLDNSGVIDWWTFFFLDYSQIFDVTLSDLPAYASADIEVTLSRGSGDVKFGELVVGQTRTIGNTAFGSSVGILDYSKKQADEFGNYFIEQRAFSKRAEYDVQIETAEIGGIHRFLSSIRGTPCVFIGNEDSEATIVYGFYRDFDIIISNPALSVCSMSVEGL